MLQDTLNPIIFAPMEIDLEINSVNDYANDIGAPTYHPHVSVIHYDEVGEIRHTINLFNVYGIFLQKNFPDNLNYGIGHYEQETGSLLADAPGQLGGKPDNGTRKQYYGWVLLFDPVFIQGTDISRRMDSYHYFEYNANEALFLTEEEKEVLNRVMATLRSELANHGGEESSDNIVRDMILLVLDYCSRFYARQFKDVAKSDADILTRFQQVLDDYYTQKLQRQKGVPSVKYCASELFLSPNYFGDVIRQCLGQSPKDYIQQYVTARAKNLLLSGKNVAQTAEELGFEYPQHFTRFFKHSTGDSPSQYQKRFSGA